jgi:hypothetical protein
LHEPEVVEAEAPVGRSRELDAIRAFLDRAATDGDALLLFGEPGVGKTALLNAAADEALAAGARVLRAAGVEFEAEMSFSALNQALLPLLVARVRAGEGNGSALRSVSATRSVTSAAVAAAALALGVSSADAAVRAVMLTYERPEQSQSLNPQPPITQQAEFPQAINVSYDEQAGRWRCISRSSTRRPGRTGVIFGHQGRSERDPRMAAGSAQRAVKAGCKTGRPSSARMREDLNPQPSG